MELSQQESDELILQGLHQAEGDLSPETLKFAFSKKDVFQAEVALADNDFIFHFYLPRSASFWTAMGVPPQQRTDAFVRQFWDEIFPACLDATARAYFKAEFPRLSAMHMQDASVSIDVVGSGDNEPRPLDSWWLKAKGFGNNTLDPEAFVARFYVALDEALRNWNRT